MPFPPDLKTKLVQLLGAKHVLDDAVTCYSYRADGLTLHPGEPMGVVFPGNTAELQEVVRLLHRSGICFVPRGAGTGLSGGAIAKAGTVIVEMVRFQAIQEIDRVNRTITVGPGVVNLHISEVARPAGLCFVPDPSSQKACTIGGNVAENSGGPHTLKYGVTTNHVLGLEVVLPDGEKVRLGGQAWGTPGPDMVGLLIGSEGTFGIVTEVTCRLTPLPERVETLLAVFTSVADASETVSAIIQAGIVPAAMEMIDRLVIVATEATMKAGFPTDAEALLIIELEDLADGLDAEVAVIREICQNHQARDVRCAADAAERARIWAARKGAFAAIGSISPSFYTQDGVIPRSALPGVLAQIAAAGARRGLQIANVFHAGDGNLHPLILYRSGDPAQVEAVLAVSQEILEICIAAGGTLSGEHGIGLEKAHLMERVYSAEDLANMQDIRKFFNPLELLNPGKIFAAPGRCSETRWVGAKSGVQA